MQKIGDVGTGKENTMGSYQTKRQSPPAQQGKSYFLLFHKIGSADDEAEGPAHPVLSAKAKAIIDVVYEQVFQLVHVGIIAPRGSIKEICWSKLTQKGEVERMYDFATIFTLDNALPLDNKGRAWLIGQITPLVHLKQKLETIQRA